MRFLTAGLLLAVLMSCDHPNSTPQARLAVAARQDRQVDDQTRDSLIYIRWNLPPLAHAVLRRASYAQRYDLYIGLNPYYQRGLFDHDSIPDLAVRIIEKSTGKIGILIIHARDSSAHILGAGIPFGNGGDDFRWASIWRVEPRSARPDIATVGGELLYVEKPESAGGMIWWNGTTYVWTQHGD
jgi:hypothetical protein